MLIEKQYNEDRNFATYTVYSKDFRYLISKKNHFRFFARNCESIVNLFCFDIISI